MKKSFVILVLSIIYISIVTYPTSRLSYETCFTPPQRCGDLIVSNINKASHSIFVQAYGFTSKKIIDALLQAKNRGLDVEIILDHSNFHKNKQSILDLLKKNQIRVYQDKVSGIAHNKVMIIDSNKVITGSFNFTENADKRNAENVIVLTNDDIAKEYYQNWKNRKICK
jgi:phospholipase D